MLLAECCGQLRARAEMKQQQLSAFVSGPADIRGQYFLVTQTDHILLDNAMKYTEEGGTITATLRRDGDRVVLDVRDTGIGIPAAELSNIIRRLYRADVSRNREQGGSGLGLAIAK